MSAYVKQLSRRAMDAALSRIEATRGTRAHVRTLIAQGRGAEAEPDPHRRERYQSRAESLQGPTVDFVPSYFLDRGARAKRAVARVIDGNGSPLGTGFLISPRLFITNHHVLPDAAEAEVAQIELDYELSDGGGALKAVTRFRLAPRTLFLASSEEDLDYAVIAVGKHSAGDEPLESFGYCALSDSEDRHVVSGFVNIVQHPRGRPKELCLRENRITARDDRVLLYEADTLPGSSGSPAFNDYWEVIALHHYGAPSRSTGAGQPDVLDGANEGIRISAIVRDLRRRIDQLDAREKELLESALALPTRGPELARAQVAPSRPAVSPGRDVATAGLEIVLRIGGRDVTLVPAVEARGAEKVKIDSRYSNRRGYSADFLGIHVPLPIIGNAGSIAPLLEPTGENDHVLHYQHFSVVMNKLRKLAFFTAVNIDGDRLVELDRDSGQPAEAAEAAERWTPDPRIRPDHQLQQAFFSAHSRFFDRGHLVRRQDPTWGSKRKAVRANADTFHFTNCSPQNWIFNQKLEYWQGLEQYLLEHGAVADQEKISVFGGPIFDAGDPEFSGLAVPLQYWKIVARVHDGELRATGFVVDQSEILRIPRGGSESSRADITEKATEWIYSIRELARLTKLNFGPLTAADTFEREGSEGAEKRRRINSWEDVERIVRRRAQRTPRNGRPHASEPARPSDS